MISRLDREDFLLNFWGQGLWKPGEHVFLIGPTQRAGKSTLGFQLLNAADKTGLKTTVFCMKPRDRTVASFSEQYGFRETAEWPPKKKLLQEKTDTYTLWPRHSFDVDNDNAHIKSEFRKAMMDSYRRGNSILFLDEIYGIAAELHLQEEVVAILTRGGGMGCSAWMACQKPGGTQGKSLPGFAFNSPTHFFISQDNDARNRERFSELAGGHDPKEIESITTNLAPFNFLYLNANGQKAVIGA